MVLRGARGNGLAFLFSGSGGCAGVIVVVTLPLYHCQLLFVGKGGTDRVSTPRCMRAATVVFFAPVVGSFSCVRKFSSLSMLPMELAVFSMAVLGRCLASDG